MMGLVTPNVLEGKGGTIVDDLCVTFGLSGKQDDLPSFECSQGDQSAVPGQDWTSRKLTGPELFVWFA